MYFRHPEYPEYGYSLYVTSQFPGNAKSKSKMLFLLSGRISPVKSSEYSLLILIRNSRTIILYIKLKIFFIFFYSHFHPATDRHIACPVIQKDFQYLTDSGTVTLTDRKRLLWQNYFQEIFFPCRIGWYFSYVSRSKVSSSQSVFIILQDLLSAFARESISPISRDILSPSLFMVFKNLPAFSQSDSIACTLDNITASGDLSSWDAEAINWVCFL